MRRTPVHFALPTRSPPTGLLTQAIVTYCSTSGSSRRSSIESVTSRSTMPKTRSVQVATSRRGDERRVDPVEGVVGDDQWGDALDGEGGVRRWRGRRSHDGRERAADAPGVPPGLPPAPATFAVARPSSSARPTPPPTTASAPRAPARTRKPRRPIAGLPSVTAAAVSRNTMTSIPTAACRAAESTVGTGAAVGDRRPASAPTPAIATMPIAAGRRLCRATRPSAAPATSTTAVMKTPRASLSVVPNRPTM